MEFTEHATERMKERNVSRLDIEHVIATAHTSYAQSHGTTRHHGTTLDGRPVAVVTETEDWDRIITIRFDY